MRHRPIIKTAMPKQRYQLGDYVASLLGEIESGDHRSYRYILAFIHPGRAEPELYVWSEAAQPGESAAGNYRLWVEAEGLSELVDTDERWGDLELFAAQALKLGAQALGLQHEQTRRLI